jgi:hypothetical protein
MKFRAKAPNAVIMLQMKMLQPTIDMRRCLSAIPPSGMPQVT